MGEFYIFLLGLVSLGLVLQVYMYKGKKTKKSDQISYIVNLLYGILVTYIAYSSFPDNYLREKAIILGLGLINILSWLFWNKKLYKTNLSKILVTISIGLSLIYWLS